MFDPCIQDVFITLTISVSAVKETCEWFKENFEQARTK